MLILEKNAMTDEIEQLVAVFGNERTSLLPILQSIQRKHNFIPDFAQQEVARLLEVIKIDRDGNHAVGFLPWRPK